jgi:hypothetical protein
MIFAGRLNDTLLRNKIGFSTLYKMIRIIIICMVLLPLSSYGQIDRFEFYGGLNLTRPYFSEDFASSEAKLGYTIGGLYTVRKSAVDNLSIQIGLGFSNRTYTTRLVFSNPDEPLKEIFSKNYLNDFEFPILGAYILDFSDYQVIFKVGLIPGFNVLYKSDLRFINISNAEGIPKTYSEVRTARPNAFRRMNIFTGVTLVKKFQNINLGLQPNLQYNFLPGIQENSLGPKFWTYGLNLTFTKQ